MKDNPFVSVVVPIYNAEKTLHHCLTSIIDQTYNHLEIILVNDGSTDQSLQICQQFAHRDERIKVINQRNKGPSYARNIGIKYATGTYIQFVDADDVITETMVDLLIDCVHKKIDLVICGYYVITEKNCTATIPATSGVFSFEHFTEHIGELCADNLLQSPCNKLYKTALIKENDITFPINISLGEDLLFNLNYLNRCRAVFVTEQPLYIYKNRKGSLSKQIHTDYFNHQLMLIEQVEQFLHNNQADYNRNRSSLRRVFSQVIINSFSQLIERVQVQEPNHDHSVQIKDDINDLITNKKIRSHLPHLTGSTQARLLQLLIHFKLTRTTYLFIKIKYILKRRTNRCYSFLKKMNEYSKRFNMKERT